MRTLQSGSVDNRPSSPTVAIDTICTATENRNIFLSNFYRQRQSELLIASTGSAVADFHRNLSAGNQTGAGIRLTHLPQAGKQIVCRRGIIPIITAIIDFNRKAGALSNFGGSFKCDLIRQDGPPARIQKRGIVGLGSFL